MSFGADMLAYLAADRRLLGFNAGDWVLLLGALTLVVSGTYLLT